MPKLLSHIPNSVKGNIIPLSREDYLRQQYQNYLKSQAEKGRKAVVEGREKFAKDYVIPAIKTAGSFTPAGPLIGLADAYDAYQEGNTGWAVAGAAAEALPYVGKGVSKVAKMIPGLGKDAPELAFHALNSDHWALHPSDLEGTTKDKLYLYQLALANRLMPIAKKTPIIKPIRKKAETIMSETPFFARHPQKTNYAKYNKQVGSFTGQIDGKPDRNLLKLYLYGDETGFTEAGEDVLTMDFGKRYKDLYPKAKYYIMDSAREHGRPIYGSNDDDLINLTEDSLSDIIKNKKRFRSSVGYANINPVKPIDNIAGHQIEIRGDLSTPTFVTQDLWKTNPLDYSKKYSKKLGIYNNNYGKLLLEKQAGLLDKVGNPFYLVQNNPIVGLKNGGIIPKAQEGTIFNKTNTQMKNTFATGGQMRNATNSQFIPSYVNGVPVYGFGSWLKKNAGNVLQVAGGVGAMFIPGMQGVGATLIGNGVTGALDQGLQDKQQKDAEAMQRADAERSFMLNQYNDSQQVFASPEGFAKGGSIHIDPSKRGTFTVAATKHGQSVQGFASQVLANKDKYSPAMVKKAVFAHNFAKANGGFVPTYEQGGFMNGLKFYNDGGDIDGLTYFPVGGTHESNPNNGIPLGGNALVEEGEFMWESPTRGKYIFSNRF